MFSQAKNIHISGQASFVYKDIKYDSSPGAESLDEGVRLLLPRVVTGAMHNSAERFDAPACHPDTRLAIQNSILQWADEPVDDCREIVTWLCGPAGAGKSAIAQTIALKLHARGQLTASFFFSRGSGGERRGEETNFVATLAHQLSLNLPATKPHILTAIRENPLVFDLALQDQMNALIIAPLLAVYNGPTNIKEPHIIVVDGLDECRKENNAQRRVVDALIWGLAQIPHHNHKLFITSRPEHNIISIFKNYEGRLWRRMELNDSWKPNDDIRIFLNTGFMDIRRSHFYFASHPVDKTWPSSRDIQTLVQRSSGQFIYASVVLKYIKSEENYNPITRLKIILDLKDNEDQPYAELDSLYYHIFSQIRGVERVLTVLSLDQMCSKPRWPALFLPFSAFLPEFIGVDMEEIKFWLVPLASLLVWEGSTAELALSPGSIHYMHASLPDFLLDRSRSNSFCVNTPIVASKIVCRAIELIQDQSGRKKHISTSLLMGIPSYYASVLPFDQKHHVYSVVSNFNVVETVLEKMNTNLGAHTLELFRAVVTYLNWILTEFDDKNASECLSKPVAQIKTWLVNQFAQLDCYLHNEQIDLWPFSVTRSPSTEMISEDLSLALEVCRSSTPRGQLPRETRVQVSHQTALLSHLMPHIPRWIERHDLLGRHAMTTERYGRALQRIVYYLLQLPKDVLEEILGGSNDGSVLQTPIMRLICQVLPTFLSRAPRTPDLYFLVALADPVMAYIIMYGNPYVSTYLEQTLKDFPFLNDSTSSGHIEAQLRVKAACVRLEIQTNFHELVAEMDLMDEELVPYTELLEAFSVIDRRISASTAPVSL